MNDLHGSILRRYGDLPGVFLVWLLHPYFFGLFLLPGHGGNDPGKIGVSGQEEKAINLKIAMKLKKYLEAADVKVVMTRESDKGLYRDSDSHKKSADMKERCRIIDEAKPVMAISIHQNS